MCTLHDFLSGKVIFMHTSTVTRYILALKKTARTPRVHLVDTVHNVSWVELLLVELLLVELLLVELLLVELLLVELLLVELLLVELLLVELLLVDLLLVDRSALG